MNVQREIPRATASATGQTLEGGVVTERREVATNTEDYPYSPVPVEDPDKSEKSDKPDSEEEKSEEPLVEPGSRRHVGMGKASFKR